VKTMETFVVCAQLCGEGHANMIGTMEVIPAADFDSWATGQSEFALKANQKAAEAATASVSN
jgi:cytochrome c oxidase subunit II